MSLLNFGVICLVINAVVHLLQHIQIHQDATAQRGMAGGVSSFFLVYGLLAALVGIGFSWAYGPAIAIPLIGGIGLTATFRNAPGLRMINIAIIVLDILCVLTFGYLLFLA